MAIFTIEEVTRAAFSAAGVQNREQFEKQSTTYVLAETIKQRTVTCFDIFLSHAYSDRAVVIGLYNILKGLGFSAYVDWIHDPQLNRQQITPTTADVLRRRMQQSKSLIYATTVNSGNSRWMPWECGFFHGHDGHVAILPVLATASTPFTGQEYLGLYPFAQKGPGTGRKSLRIHSQVNQLSAVEFDLWIAGTKP